MHAYPASQDSLARTSARRFTGEPTTAFGGLSAGTDVVELTIGYDHPRDDSLIDWSKRLVSRKEAADALRNARAAKHPISITLHGFSIYRGINPAWSYE